MQNTYNSLIERHALRPIKSIEDLEQALEVATEMYDSLSSLSADETDYLDVLSDLIAKFEKVHYSRKGSFTPIENVKYLFEVNGLRQADLAKIINVPSGRASEIWHGLRDLSKTHVALLAERFAVNAALFLPKVEKQAKATDPFVEAQKTYQRVYAVKTKVDQIMSRLNSDERKLIIEALTATTLPYVQPSQLSKIQLNYHGPVMPPAEPWNVVDMLTSGVKEATNEETTVADDKDKRRS